MYKEVWDLLKMYTYVVNDRLRARGLKPQGQLKVMGAIAQRFLLAQRSEIIDDYREAVVRNKLSHIPFQKTDEYSKRSKYAKHFPPAPPRTAPIPILQRISGIGQGRTTTTTEEASDIGPLRWNSRGPDPLGRRLSAASRKIRNRESRASGTTGVWDQIHRALE